VTAIAGTRTGRSLGWWGTVCLIATEAMVFALLLFGWFYLWAIAPHWPLGDIKDPELMKSGIRTAILLGSSIPIHIAERAIKAGKRGRAARALALGWLMGAVFLAGHLMEYAELWKDFRPSTNAYGSAFYTITGLHAAHLLVGLVVIAYLLVRTVNGRYDEHRHEPIVNGAMYWHFVDAVWAVVYTSLYLAVSLR
jgi:heme/copper-type cytochrome/quinol oxidase subunit 3